MPIENERKYVLEISPKMLKTLQSKIKETAILSQFYMESIVGQSIRGRSVESANQKEYIFTYKYRPALAGLPKGANIEVETSLSKYDYDLLFQGSIRNLTKQRFHMEHLGLHWDIDVFLDKEDEDNIFFAMAEVEMPKNMIKPDSFPKWLRPFIIHDVEPGDESFSSYALCNIEYGKNLYDDILNDTYKPWKKDVL